MDLSATAIGGLCSSTFDPNPAPWRRGCSALPSSIPRSPNRGGRRAVALLSGWRLGEVRVENIRHDSPCSIALFLPYGKVLAAIFDRVALGIMERQLVGSLGIADVAGAGRLYFDGMARNQKARHREELRPNIANRVLAASRGSIGRQDGGFFGVVGNRGVQLLVSHCFGPGEVGLADRGFLCGERIGRRLLPGAAEREDGQPAPRRQRRSASIRFHGNPP